MSKERKMKITIIVILVIIFILCFLFEMLCITNKDKRANNSVSNKNSHFENKIDNEKSNDTSNKNDNKKKEDKKEDSKTNQDENKKNDDNKDLNNESNNSSNTNSVDNNESKNENTSSQPSEPVVTYSCPDGYNLNGSTCTSIVSASLECAEGSHHFSDGNVSGCIIFSEGFESENGSCPGGYGTLKQISFGADDKYYCYPVHSEIYNCPDGYSLSGDSCVSSVAASAN